MKVKDIERTANVTWSPKSYHPIYLAAGTAAQQLDASFSTNAALEIYALNLAEIGPDCKLVSSIPTEHRFHKLVWGAHGSDTGTVIGGCDDGLMNIYNASKLIKGEPALVGQQQKHTGPVHAIDLNSFQPNLFASGAGDSEIFIWDLNNPSSPMSPGAKSQPLEDILSVAWNKQVQHILASSFASKCVIWDLRKNEPIIKLTDTVSRVRWKQVTWHPEVATQLCLASEEDHSPVIQMWDLRFATSPLKTLENHQRGILAVSWCTEDADLLISAGKDDRILCWNPNSNIQNGEVLAEIAKTNQWSFDVVWCPRNPALIACPNFDGHVSVYSLMGGKTQQIQTSNKIADSFPGMEGYAQAPVIQQSTVQVSNDLTKPPNWLRRPVGASFGFGGKLITFENDKEALAQAQQNIQPGQQVPKVHRTVQISQVITEPELIRKSGELEAALAHGNFIDYCRDKSDSTNDQHKKYIWHYLKAHFDDNPRAEILNLLGYRIEDINAKLKQHTGIEDVDDVNDEFSKLTRLEDISQQFNTVNGYPKKLETSFKIKTGEDTEGLITQALLLNNVEAAVELCLKAERYADALIIATTGGADLLARTQHRYLEKSEGYIASLISAIVSEDWTSIINNCDINSWKEALAAILTHASDDDMSSLCEQLGSRLEKESIINSKHGQEAQLCYICSGNFDKLVNSWSENINGSTEHIQELVELVSFLQKAIERKGKQVQLHGALADLLSRYASILASQGNLSTALTYLGSSNDPKITSLRERLLINLGQKHQAFTESHPNQPSRRNSTRTSFSQYFQNPPASVQPQLPQGNNFNVGLPNAPLNTQPWQSQGVAPPSVNSFNQPANVGRFSPAPPPMQLPRPGSVGPTSGSSVGLPSRKHVLDPSVTSNQYGSRNRYPSYPEQQIQQPYSSLPTQNSNYAENVYKPPPISNPYGNSISQQMPTANALTPNPVLSPAPSLQNPMLNPTGPMVPNPVLNPSPLVPNISQSSTQSMYGAPPLTNQVEPAQSALNYANLAPSGWNDPPVFSKKHQQKHDQPHPEPIRHPLFGSAPEPPMPQNNGYGTNAPPPPMHPYNQSAQMYPQNPPTAYQPPQQQQPIYNPGGFNQNAISAVEPANIAREVVKPETPVPVQKPPIPEEHIHMQTVFDELKNKCSCSTTNPQMKRKLEDVGKRLENLYDSLRYNKLSPNALESLHQMVQLVQNGDYSNGLMLHASLVQGPDFSQIASFMPGLKVLLQMGLQLRVYL